MQAEKQYWKLAPQQYKLTLKTKVAFIERLICCLNVRSPNSTFETGPFCPLSRKLYLAKLKLNV